MRSLTIHKLGAINIFLNRRGLGLLLLGVLDGSIVPTFGLLDQFAGVFAAREQSLWVYYAAISTIGATIGALTTYRLGRKLGSRSLETKFGVKRTLTVRRLLERWEFAAVFVPALAPPPFPTSLFLFAAGSLNYRIPKYLCAVVLGKAIRHGVITISYLTTAFTDLDFLFIRDNLGHSPSSLRSQSLGSPNWSCSSGDGRNCRALHEIRLKRRRSHAGQTQLSLAKE